MSTVEISEETLRAASREAKRRGTKVSEVVDKAVQRFIVGADLRDLLKELRERDASSDDTLSEADALELANDELAAVRATK